MNLSPKVGAVGSSGDGNTTAVWYPTVFDSVGVYSVCWCVENCATDADFVVFVADLEVVTGGGPSGLEDASGAALNPLAGEPFDLVVTGTFLSTNDRIRIVEDGVERFGCRATESFEALHIRIRSK